MLSVSLIRQKMRSTLCLLASRREPSAVPPKSELVKLSLNWSPKRAVIYAGGVGYFAPDGSVDSCIVLRTAVIKDGTMHVTAGAGIVADSDPDYEQRECEAKAGALIAAAREAARIASEPGFGQ